ncbi:MAG: T9SS type A sorting domain-containing protein [Bacteroidales bacterium]|nr:T9SS type A sorting domain-containing protein [Bacteroidales bacterium]
MKTKTKSKTYVERVVENIGSTQILYLFFSVFSIIGTDISQASNMYFDDSVSLSINKSIPEVIDNELIYIHFVHEEGRIDEIIYKNGSNEQLLDIGWNNNHNRGLGRIKDEFGTTCTDWVVNDSSAEFHYQNSSYGDKSFSLSWGQDIGFEMSINFHLNVPGESFYFGELWEPGGDNGTPYDSVGILEPDLEIIKLIIPYTVGYQEFYNDTCMGIGIWDSRFNEVFGYRFFPKYNISVGSGLSLDGPYMEIESPNEIYFEFAIKDSISFWAWVHGYENNVGVQAIVSPTSIIPLDTIINPKAIVRNWGIAEATFPVCFYIDTLYFDEKNITLSSFTSDTITFDTWTANTPGTYLTKCKTLLEGDEYSANDSLLSTVIVSSGIGPDIYSITPNYGGNTGSVTVEITGYGFEEGAAVKLTRNGQPEIIADSLMTTIIDSTKIVTTLYLVDAEIGQWNVVVSNPDGNEGTFYNGYEIQIGFENLWANITSMDEIRVGQPTTIVINYGNYGNTDASNLWLGLGLPMDFSFDINIPDALPPQANPPNIPTGNDIIKLILLDVSDMKIGITDILTLELTATSVGQFNLYLDFTTNPDAYFNSLLNLPDSINIDTKKYELINIDDDWPQIDSSMLPPAGYVMIWKEPIYNLGQFKYHIAKSVGNGEYIEMLRNDNGPDLQISSLINSVGDNGYLGALRPPNYDVAHGQLIIERANNLIDMYGTDDKSEWVTSLCQNNSVDDVLKTNCLGVFHILNPEFRSYGLKYWKQIYYTLASPYRWYGPYEKNLYKFFGYFTDDPNHECFEGYENITSGLAKQISVVNSWDPNDKAGPSGYGEMRFVPPFQPFYYIIHFENVDSATAAAQYVKLSDTLNTNLDWATLVFDTTSHIPTSQTFDPATGIIEWEFEDINLPPNVTPPEGEGWVMFHIDQLPDLPSGTQITNKASIKFDYNDPMLTGTVLNTIDAGYPVSSMNTLTTHLDSTKYLISWSGQDDYLGSGIRDYTIYYSEHQDSTYTEWLRNVPDTTAIFTGEYEKTYYFYSVARDGVGYIESPPDSYDLALYVNLGVEENDLLNPNFLRIYPNPFSDKTTIEFNNPNQLNYKLSVFSITGNKVLEIENIIINKIEIEKGNLSKGIYIVELKGEKVFNNKMIIIK